MNDDFENWLNGREKEPSAEDGGMLRPGQRIGAYRIVRQLGVGGMGQVYEAEHVALGVRRALKVFSTVSEHSEFLRKRFVAEGRILADLRHPRIVRVYDLVVDEDSGMAYFEMDLVLSPDGESCTLSDILQDGVDEEKIVGWFRDICEGLAYIHSQGVVHRDISLDNILIGRDGRAVITDFGIAKIIDDSYRRKIAVTATMVFKDGTEMRIGKERYMAPELKKPDGKASFATDAWALGVLLFRMLSGSWYDVGTRLEDWHADLKYDWHRVISQLCDLDPGRRLADGGIAALPMRLKRSGRFVSFAWRRLCIWCGIAAAAFVVAIGASWLIENGVAINFYDQERVNLKYEVVTNEGIASVKITKGENVRGDVVIPGEFNGCRVTSIGEKSFEDCDGLTSVTIPDGVTDVGEIAFENCVNLISVTIPSSVTNIEDNAFAAPALRIVYVSRGDAKRIEKLLSDSLSEDNKGIIENVKFLEKSVGEVDRAGVTGGRGNWPMVVLLFVAICAVVGVGVVLTRKSWWDYSMKLSGRLYPSDRSFSILPIDDTELMPLDELGITGWGMGGSDDCPVVFIQKLAYSGDFELQRELQGKLGATYGGRTTVCEEEVQNSVLRVEIDNWREGDRLLYVYRKLFVAGSVIYQVSGQTQMHTKDRDRTKLKSVVDSFKLR